MCCASLNLYTFFSSTEARSKSGNIFNVSTYPSRRYGSREGTFLAATTFLDLTIKGVGGHAAVPHLTKDPVLTSAQIITNLQSIISRELDPLDSGVVSISAIQGGQAANVIPPEVKMLGTLRSLTMDGLKKLQNRVKEVAEKIAEAHDCEAIVEYPGNDYPPTVNDSEMWDFAKKVGSDMLGKENVSDLRNTKVIDLIRSLKRKGHKVDVNDPLAYVNDVKKKNLNLTSLSKKDKYDTIILTVPHNNYKKLNYSFFNKKLNKYGKIFDLKAIWKRKKFPKTIEYLIL